MKLDLNFPGFQDDLFKLEKKELHALIKTLQLCAKMDFQQLNPFIRVECRKDTIHAERARASPVFAAGQQVIPRCFHHAG